MTLHNGPVVVRFHGGFLDGKVSRSGEKPVGAIAEIWNAEAIYFATRGQIGAAMVGLSDEGLLALQRSENVSAKTFIMDHAYRVTALTLDKGVMTIDVQHELVE